MPMLGLHHATINTLRLAETIAFYSEVLGLEPGERPDFGFGGAWLYSEGTDDAIIHLIECVSLPEAQGGPFDHVAFRYVNLREYVRTLEQRGDWYCAARVTGTQLTQVHHFDPNGVRIEAVFEELLDVDILESSVPPLYDYPPRKMDSRPGSER
jgi:catechol 2,3-dioxygenase-like lactoylglutathione lyase family enzyme